MQETISPVLRGQKVLVVGVANDQSIAYGCAKAFLTEGPELAITWLSDASGLKDFELLLNEAAQKAPWAGGRRAGEPGGLDGYSGRAPGPPRRAPGHHAGAGNPRGEPPAGVCRSGPLGEPAACMPKGAPPLPAAGGSGR